MKKILVVDDVKEIRDLVEKTLSRDDRQVLKAENGAQAVDLAKEHHPDLILIDVMMPGEYDGLEAIRIMRNDPSTAQTKMVVLTAKGREDDREAGFEAGADDYFIKPFSPLELLRKVDEMLDMSN